MLEFEKSLRGSNGLLMTISVLKNGYIVGFIERTEEHPLAGWYLLDAKGKRQEVWGITEFSLMKAKQAAIELFK